MQKALNITNLNNTFDNFITTSKTDEIKLAFMDILDGRRFMLLCYGGVGNGKTHLCEASAIELYKRGYIARVCRFAKLLSTLKESMNNTEMSYEEILNNYCDAPRLILDDIGSSGSDTEFGDRILETIVTARYGYERLTIMTTNMELSKLPERVQSRFQDKSTSYLVFNEAPDYRGVKEAG